MPLWPNFMNTIACNVKDSDLYDLKLYFESLFKLNNLYK